MKEFERENNDEMNSEIVLKKKKLKVTVCVCVCVFSCEQIQYRILNQIKSKKKEKRKNQLPWNNKNGIIVSLEKNQKRKKN